MSFTTRTTDDLVRIAVAGGGFRLEANVRKTDDLVRIAVAAAGKGLIIFSGMATRTTDDLVKISVAGKGSVHFED